MSAIAGVFSRRGERRRPGEVDRMLSVMASRGPDGTHTWVSDTVTLGHGALHATPESVNEVMPLVDRATGNVVVADVRLDNRGELLDALRLDDVAAANIGDGRLLLDAYREWGENCVEHLLGDFAFAIWDERRGQLFLARDHFGAKPMTYHCSDQLVAFASDSRSVVGLEDVPATIDRDRVFDFLVDVTEWIDTTSTFFAEVRRLPPAHVLTITATDRRLRRYWHLPEPEMLRLSADAEYEEATREVLDLAVRCRLRGRGDVGFVVSGGIDSSSLVAIASAHGRVHSYSAVTNHDDTTESAFIRATAAKLALAVAYVDSTQVVELCGDFAGNQRAAESLFDNGAMVHALFAAARNDGCRSVVTGVLGDEVVTISASSAMRAMLAAHRRAEVAELVRSDGDLAAWSGRSGLVRSAVSVMLTRNGRLERVLTSRRARQRVDWLRRALGDGVLRLCADERSRLIERLDESAAQSAPGSTPWSTRRRLFDGGYSAAALERYDRSAAACSLESRSPYMDRRVVEFFLRLPADQLVAGGWSKSVVRRSMAALLPPPVVWNREKPDLGPEFGDVWVDRDPMEFLRELPSNHVLHEFVDQAKLCAGSDDDAVDSEEWRLRCMSLGLWIEPTTTL